jgi:tRNA-binding protein
MATITWGNFEMVELRAGTIVDAKPFPEARKPAFQLWIDLGKDLGIKKSSAQITQNYSLEELPGKQVICVTNFAPRQIGKFMSEVLVTGFPDENGNVVLAQPGNKVPNGVKLY